MAYNLILVNVIVASINPNFGYTLDNHQISTFNSTLDHGILHINDFTYNAHCTDITGKANHICTFILQSSPLAIIYDFSLHPIYSLFS